MSKRGVTAVQDYEAAAAGKGSQKIKAIIYAVEATEAVGAKRFPEGVKALKVVADEDPRVEHEEQHEGLQDAVGKRKDRLHRAQVRLHTAGGPCGNN